MSRDRLPAHIEAASILRRAEAAGDFATILRKGDPERGSLLLVIGSRGRHVACLERVLSIAHEGYVWQPVGPGESASSADLAAFLAKRARFDDDSWAIELDIAEPERFIAETTGLG
jgi:hypothetical protein